jgi:predicted TIM-barrel fold metal-dependent hydrolase
MIDCHVHFIDASRFCYPIFRQRSAGFEALVGDYSALPCRYLPADYLADAGGLQIEGTVCAEFIVECSARRTTLGAIFGRYGCQPTGMIVCVDFRAPVLRIHCSFASRRLLQGRSLL